jgi:RNA polymerase sigma factor (TIGR02999 family)
MRGRFWRVDFSPRGALAPLAGSEAKARPKTCLRRSHHLQLLFYAFPTIREYARICDTVDEPSGDITILLQQWREGDKTAEERLFDLVMPNLRRLAHYLMKGERRDHSLDATELVNQIYFRLVAAKDRDWRSRRHFFAIAARAMRRYLIDHARGRPDAEFVALEGNDDLFPADSSRVDLAITIDRLLDGLGKENPEWCMLVEMKYFLGLTDEEAAEAMNVKLRTMQRMWSDARQWLFVRMEAGHAPRADAKQNAGR